MGPRDHRWERVNEDESSTRGLASSRGVSLEYGRTCAEPGFVSLPLHRSAPSGACPGGLPLETSRAPGHAPPRTTLGPTEVHVWRVDLDRPASGIASLSDEERARAARFHADRDRLRFTAGHATLRSILGLYVGCRPEELAFEIGLQGKPALADPRWAGIAFNLSHSDGVAVVAVASRRRVGVDVEAVRPMADRDAIVARFFSARERADFARLPEALKTPAFFRVWTSKEAYIKAIGTGLSTPLDGFSVAVDPREPPALREVEGRPDEPTRWMIRDLVLGEGYAGAVMVEETDWNLVLYDYHGAVQAPP